MPQEEMGWLLESLKKTVIARGVSPEAISRQIRIEGRKACWSEAIQSRVNANEIVSEDQCAGRFKFFAMTVFLKNNY